jgi:hypothetical protein
LNIRHQQRHDEDRKELGHEIADFFFFFVLCHTLTDTHSIKIKLPSPISTTNWTLTFFSFFYAARRFFLFYFLRVASKKEINGKNVFFSVLNENASFFRSFFIVLKLSNILKFFFLSFVVSLFILLLSAPIDRLASECGFDIESKESF